MDMRRHMMLMIPPNNVACTYKAGHWMMKAYDRTKDYTFFFKLSIAGFLFWIISMLKVKVAWCKYCIPFNHKLLKFSHKAELVKFPSIQISIQRFPWFMDFTSQVWEHFHICSIPPHLLHPGFLATFTPAQISIWLTFARLRLTFARLHGKWKV